MIKWILKRLQPLLLKTWLLKRSVFYFQKKYFKKITVVETTPEIKNLKEKEFIEVNYKNKSYWVLFKCPCGCGEVITLSTQHSHNPHWNIKENNFQLPSLFPSVWKNNGCYSHFWIKNGKIKWCNNSGIKPSN